MLAKAALLLITFHSTWVPSAVSTRSLSPDDLSLKLSKPVVSYDLGVSNFVAGLIRVSNDFQIPIGIVWVDLPSARAELPFAWKASTVQGIIEALVKTQPGYQMETRNGVVHVFPSGVIPGSQNFLKLKIGNFEVRNDFIEMASFKLHTLVTPLSGSRSISVGATGDSRVDLRLKNSSVEDILDALAVASDRKIWVVSFSGDAGLTSAGFRRTTSLWTDKTIPDSDQPLWEFVRWGDPIPPSLVAKK